MSHIIIFTDMIIQAFWQIQKTIFDVLRSISIFIKKRNNHRPILGLILIEFKQID